MKIEVFSIRRAMHIFILFLCSVLFPLICGMIHKKSADVWIVWFFISLLLYLTYFLYVEHERLNKKLPMGQSNDFSGICLVYSIGLAVAVIFSFLPAYTAPVMIISAICYGAFRNNMGTILAVYFALLSALFSEGNEYELLAYALLVIINVMLFDLFEQKTLQTWVTFLVISFSVVIPVCCNYLAKHELSGRVVVVSLVGSGLTILIMKFLSPRLRVREEKAVELSLDTIMDDAYHLKKEIEAYSTADYNHAVRTAQLSKQLAGKVNADEKIAFAGGFYYRIGKLEGEPFIENGVSIARHNCFPEAVIAILEEYGGVKRLPGTIESAIVHIADTIVTKFELLDKDMFSSTWNRDIVIYQTMNEKSSEGLYDCSGLSMNQFLTIREFLVKEDTLL
ncbi:MAG: hypothetical protein PUD20_00555 [bacterium]|nr:hypothetical protein [bacterium]